MEAFIVEINAWAWGVPMQVLLLGTGIFLTLGLGFLTLRRLGFAFRLLLGGLGRGCLDVLGLSHLQPRLLQLLPL